MSRAFTLALFSLLQTKNRFLQRIRRLKQPRYLVSMLAGLAYLYFIFGRKKVDVFTWEGQAVPAGLDGAWALGTLVIAVILMLAWAHPEDTGALEMSEAEAHFLLPAPLSLRDLLLYKIFRAQPALLFTALMLKLFVLRPNNFLSIWLTLATIQVYLLMVRIGRARLKLAGVGMFARFGVVVVAMAGLGALVWQVYEPLIAQMEGWDKGEIFPALVGPLAHPPLSIVLFVPSLFARLLVAHGTAAIGLQAIGPLVIAVGCFLIAAKLEISFEEATVEDARKRAEKSRLQKHPGERRPTVLRRIAIPLKDSGPAAAGLIWKNLTASARGGSAAVLVLGLAVVAAAGLLTFFLAGFQEACVAAGGLSLVLCIIISLVGPLFIRDDLRGELDHLDLLKSFPLSGPQIVLAEMAAPFAMILLYQLSTLAMAVAFSVAATERTAVLAAVAWLPVALIFIAPVTILQLAIHNAIVILLPAWARQMRDERQGPEALGRGILMMLGQLLALLLAVLPAALVMAAGFWLAGFTGLGVPGRAAVAAIPSVMLLGGELWLVVQFLGGQFEKMDIEESA